MTSRLPFTAAQLVARLVSQVGTTEHPPRSNETPYGAAMGLNGYAWCAMFIGWGFRQLGTDWRAWWGLPGTHWAYCPSLLTEGKARGLAVSVEQVRAGDLVLMAFSERTITARYPEHIGVATGPLAGHTVPTIEGNTVPGDSGSQANGGGVFRRNRARQLIVGVIRPPYAVPVVRPAAKPAPAATRPLVPSVGRVLRLAVPTMHGGDVLAVQGRLGGLVRDAQFGPKTGRAVVAFQRRYWPHDPSKWDGEVGPLVTRALGLRWVG